MTVGELEERMTAREWEYWKVWKFDYDREPTR